MAGDARPFGQLFAEPTRNGLTRPKAVRGSGIKMVNMGELFAYPRLRNVSMDRVTLSEAETKKFLLVEGDLLFARQSLVLEGAGKCSIFLGDDEPVTYESHVTRVRLDVHKADPHYYFYYLQSYHGRAAIRSIVEQGAGASGIRGSDLQTLNVQWWPIAEQQAIAHILGTLDDKIELNRRMNETLEAMAQALFKSWFVDTTQDGLPEGWRESTIGEEVRVVGGSTPSTSNPEFWEGGTNCWATPKDLAPLTDPVLLDTERRITDTGVQQISSGLLPVGTVLLSSRAPIGYLALAEVSVAVNQGFIAMICDGSLTNHYVRLWTKQNIEVIKGRANGTTFMEISKSNFRPLPVLVPPQSVVNDFHKQAKPLHLRVVANLRESNTLATLRDTLLPKLISGELRVKDAERFVEKA